MRCFVIFSVLVFAVSAATAEFTLDWSTVDSGGIMNATDGQPGGFVLSGTVGQPDANSVAMTGGGFTLTGGFWAGVAGSACLGDLDGDNDVDLADLAQLISNYDEPSGMSYEDGDLDGDGDVDLADLATLVSQYELPCE